MKIETANDPIVLNDMIQCDEDITILVWPDGSWVFKEEYCEEEYRFKGDDICLIDVPADADEEQIHKYAQQGVDYHTNSNPNN